MQIRFYSLKKLGDLDMLVICCSLIVGVVEGGRAIYSIP